MDRTKVLMLISLMYFSGAVIAQECPYTKEHSEGAIGCEASIELDQTHDKDYSMGAAESRVWIKAFSTCKKIGEELENSLNPIPIAGSQKSDAVKLKSGKTRYTFSRAFYCSSL